MLGKAISEALKIDVYAIQVDFALGKPVSFTHALPEIAVCMSITYNTSTLNSLHNDELMQILERHPGQNTFQSNLNRSAKALMQI